jgi:hypothetical protein
MRSWDGRGRAHTRVINADTIVIGSHRFMIVTPKRDAARLRRPDLAVKSRPVLLSLSGLSQRKLITRVVPIVPEAIAIVMAAVIIGFALVIASSIAPPPIAQ